MVWVLILAIICVVLFISSIFFYPYIKIKKVNIPTYIVVCMTTALIYIIFKAVSISDVVNNLTAKTAINPIKILVLFFSMTLISTYLDELGLFSYLANIACRKFKSKFSVFTILFIVISLLTIFTSNDIIILTLTPFICYFAKSSKINPVPYLVMEFFAANTLSMALIIGNPTNIYLGYNYGIDFISYIKVMFLPSIICSIVLFVVIGLIFKRDLKGDFKSTDLAIEIEDKPLLIIGLVHLFSSIILMAICDYIKVESYFLTLICAISLCLITLIVSCIRRKIPKFFPNLFKRLPYPLAFFLISMFVIVIALDNKGVLELIGSNLPNNVFVYGYVSNLASNMVNNIPMSVLFTNVLKYSNGNINLVYATIVGSNLGAFLTPVGALAGMMWMSILKSHDINFSYKSFIKYGSLLSVLLTTIALLFLM